MAMRAMALTLAVLTVTLSGYGSGVSRVHNPSADLDRTHRDTFVPLDRGTDVTPKNVAIFFDGTGNDLNTITNVARLYQMTVNQNRNDIAAFYTSGVGADRTGPVGLATGLGFRRDVQAAYRFLAENYAGRRDKIHLYGYSRGAFSARALAGFVYTVGLVDLSTYRDGTATPEQRDEVIHELFTAYKFAKNRPEARTCSDTPDAPQRLIDLRRCATKRVRERFGVDVAHDYADVRFAMVGLWDTVETLGLTNGEDDPDHYNWRYADQICNMDKVAHAVALHDNRAGSYTPVLMTRRRMVMDCDTPDERLIHDVVNEVWFAGDHGQIGGTEPLGYLSGVSMNWMLGQAAGIGVQGPIFPKGAQVYADRFDFVKDAEGQNRFFKVLFDRQMRGIRCYFLPGDAGDPRAGSAVQRIKIHKSVKDRLGSGVDVQLKRRAPDGEEQAALEKPVQDTQVLEIDGTAPSASGCPVVPIDYVDS